MQKMASCCIQGCNSYEQTRTKAIGYFKFPLHDIPLLKKWLRQINCSNWKPSEMSQICSGHFKEKDLDRPLNEKYPLLLPDSVPTIFTVQKKSGRKRRFEGEIIEIEDTNEFKKSSVESSDGIKSHRNKVSPLHQKPIAYEVGKEPGIAKELRNISTEKNAGLISLDRLNSQKSILRITINKKLKVPVSSKPVPFETIFLPYHGEDEIVTPDIIKIEENECISKNDTHSPNNFSIRDHSAYSKSMTSDTGGDQSKTRVQQYMDKSKQKIDPTPQIHKPYNVQAVFQDHIYSCRSKAKVQSIGSKDREEKEELKQRLEGLRQKRKREELKIIRLQNHLSKIEKQIKENNKEEIVLPELGHRNDKPPGVKSRWLLREKEEYEKLLKDVREMKLKVLRQRHNRELEKIKILQMQMTNLRQKMRKNDKEEIALYNSRHTNNWAVAKLDWMQREEEEYEKLLLDVRKIKQNYKLQKSEKKDSVKSHSFIKAIKCENVLSNEDCTIIETMQKEIQKGNKSTRNIDLIEDHNDEYGEVIGEIDEDSIDIDMSRETKIFNFNEELPVPGLLES